MNKGSLKQTKELNKNNWETPMWLFNRLHAVFNFTIDGASDGFNNLLPNHRTKDRPLDSSDIRLSSIFINPPFNCLIPFLDMYLDELAFLGCFLLPFRPETKIWHKYIWPKATIFVFNRRIQYIHPETKKEIKGASFPSCLAIFGTAKYDKKALTDLGIFIRSN